MKQKRINSFFTAILISLLALFPGKSMQAQTVLLDPAEIYIGPSFGTNASMILFNPNIQQIPLLGYNGGISFRYITEKHVGLQLEFNYSQRGWEEQDGSYARRLNYIEMPFLTHLYLGDTHRFIFNIGPKVSYLLSESVLVNHTSNSTEEQHIKPVYFPFDYGITAGLGYNLHTRHAGVFQLELRANYGLSDIFANTKSDYFSTSNNINAALNLGWFIQLTGKK
ncbi:MAG: porin family protein [Paludibacteraceae bacterium]